VAAGAGIGTPLPAQQEPGGAPDPITAFSGAFVGTTAMGALNNLIPFSLIF